MSAGQSYVSWVGNVEQERIVNAIAMCAGIRHLTAEQLMVLSEEEWRDLVAASFGSGLGSVRLGVVLAVHTREQGANR